jgi:hypothetical protein
MVTLEMVDQGHHGKISRPLRRQKTHLINLLHKLNLNFPKSERSIKQKLRRPLFNEES